MYIVFACLLQVCEWSETRSVWSSETILLPISAILLAGTASPLKDERCEIYMYKYITCSTLHAVHYCNEHVNFMYIHVSALYIHVVASEFLLANDVSSLSLHS